MQRKALPIALAGMDLVCMARTGSGKTCVFLVPMLHKLQSHQNGGVLGLVLSPTRELAAQTFKFAKDMVGLCMHTDVLISTYRCVYLFMFILIYSYLYSQNSKTCE